MKKLLLFVTVLFIAHISYGQIFSWGIKGGVNSSKITFDDFSIDKAPSVTIKPEYYDLGNGTFNPDLFLYDDNGDILFVNPAALEVTAPSVSFTPSSYELGYHFGAFARIKILALYLQPELIFSQTNANIDVTKTDDITGDILASTSKITYTNFDIPVLLGIKLGPLRLNAGPVASFKLSSVPDDATQEVLDMLDDFTAVTKQATFGGQAGVGLDLFKKLTIDVRYEFPLSKLGDSVSIGGETFNTDQRASQFLASIGWMF